MKIVLKTALVAGAALGATVVPFSGTAYADGAPSPTAAYPGGVVVASDGGSSAVVRVAYSCDSSVAPFNHLFVAVKQGPDVSPENPSSNESTTAFLSTNWSSDSGPNALHCDGRRHVQRIVVRPQGYGPLTKGPALVQICVYDNVTDPNGEGEPDGGFAASYTMERVVVSHAHGK